MDYKYINQLIERYFDGETTLEEERILHSFFSQKDVPAELAQYKALFDYQRLEVENDVLGEDFDQKIMSKIQEPAPVKARTIKMTQRLMPLFKAAAIVAIVLTLSNAVQMSFDSNNNSVGAVNGYEYNKVQHGTTVAMSDSTNIDSLQQSSIKMETSPLIIK